MNSAVSGDEPVVSNGVESLLDDGVRLRTAAFFAFCRERHAIYLKRRAGEPWPWTDDPILREHRFTNVFRELDRTTVWFRENVRDRLSSDPSVLLATVLFRWFNRIEIGEVIFGQLLFGGRTAWDVFRDTGDVGELRSVLQSAYPRGPYVTGAYMLRSPTGYSKLDGILKLCSDFYHASRWSLVAEGMLRLRENPQFARAHSGDIAMERTLQWLTSWLKQTPGQGEFTAYEVACDLLYTDLLRDAPDRMTWANPGPGAARGLNLIHGRKVSNPRKSTMKHLYRVAVPEKQLVREMQDLLSMSLDSAFWPTEWQSWDMRTVEHSLCEAFKYERARLTGQGPRQRYYQPGARR